MSEPLDPAQPLTDPKVLLCCADVLTGAETLAQWRAHGVPETQARLFDPPVDPAALLERLLATLTHQDMLGGFAPLWGAAAALWRRGKNVTLETAATHVQGQDRDAARSALRYCRAHGMGLALTAPVAAARLVRFTEARRVYSQAQEAAVQALSEASEAFLGVV